MAPRSDVSEERKAQILEAARKTFSARGFHNTRMSDIAEESGLSKGALYWYFDSKDAIILSLLQKVFEPEIRDLQALLGEDRSAEERLLVYAERGAEDIQNMLKWMPLLYEFLVLAFRRGSIKKFISTFYDKNMELLEGLIQQGIDAGEFQLDDARSGAIAMGAIIEGTLMLWMYDPEEIDIKSHVMSSIRILLQGMTASP